MSKNSPQRTSFPQARQVQIDYSSVEDRVVLYFTLVSGERVAAWIPRRIMDRLIRGLNKALRKTHPAAEDGPANDAVMALEHIAARSELADQEAGEKTEEAGETPGPEAESGAAPAAEATPPETEEAAGPAAGDAAEPASPETARAPAHAAPDRPAAATSGPEAEGAPEAPGQEAPGNDELPADEETDDSRTPEATPYLITRENIEAQKKSLFIGLSGHALPAAPETAETAPPQPVAGLFMARHQAHGILRMLAAQAEKANWDLAGPLSWMARLKRRRKGKA